VDHGYDLRVRKHGSAKRYMARATCSSADLDLALVEIIEDTEEFWACDIPACEWAEALPSLQARVNVIGFPTGGSTVCVTEVCRSLSL
jgi:hypothetical protein